VLICIEPFFPTPGSHYHSARCEMDSRADTVCAGENFIPMFHHGTECDVSGYSDELGTMKNIPVMTVATEIDDVSQDTHFYCHLCFVLWPQD
jgi:hypothetical protein